MWEYRAQRARHKWLSHKKAGQGETKMKHMHRQVRFLLMGLVAVATLGLWPLAQTFAATPVDLPKPGAPHTE